MRISSIKFKILTTERELNSYKEKYYSLSCLKTEVSFLRESTVYGLFYKDKMYGGYVLHHMANSCRTLESFVCDSSRLSFCHDHDISSNCSEICCFWLHPKTPKYKMTSFILWIHLGLKVSSLKYPQVLFGTNSIALARVYSFPTRSVLVHKDKINGKSTWTFIGRKRDFLLGVFSIIRKRIQSPSKNIRLWQPAYLQLIHQ